MTETHSSHCKPERRSGRSLRRCVLSIARRAGHLSTPCRRRRSYWQSHWIGTWLRRHRICHQAGSPSGSRHGQASQVPVDASVSEQGRHDERTMISARSPKSCFASSDAQRRRPGKAVCDQLRTLPSPSLSDIPQMRTLGDMMAQDRMGDERRHFR